MAAVGARPWRSKDRQELVRPSLESCEGMPLPIFDTLAMTIHSTRATISDHLIRGLLHRSRAGYCPVLSLGSTEGPLAMLDDSYYDLLIKYESTEPDFDPNELAT